MRIVKKYQQSGKFEPIEFVGPLPYYSYKLAEKLDNKYQITKQADLLDQYLQDNYPMYNQMRSKVKNGVVKLDQYIINKMKEDEQNAKQYGQPQFNRPLLSWIQKWAQKLSTPIRPFQKAPQRFNKDLYNYQFDNDQQTVEE